VEYSLNQPLPPDKATELINEITTYADFTLDLTDHCQEKFLERSFDFQDLLLVLSNGKVRSPAEYDEKYTISIKLRVQHLMAIKQLS